MRWLLLFLIVAGLAAGGAFVLAGRAEGPRLDIHQPARFIGQAGTLDVSATSPGGVFESLTIMFEQEGRQLPLFTLGPAGDATVKQESVDSIRITLPIGRQRVPELKPGPVRLIVSASRKVLFGLRRVESRATRDLVARFDPPRLAVLSTHHYINLGGSEFLVYRATPPDVESGVMVGDLKYAGFPASGSGLTDPSIKVAFFALLYDQDLDTPIELYARDEAGNEARTPVDRRAFPKVFLRSRIDLDDRFLQRVVPGILRGSPELKVDASQEDLLAAFLEINGRLRQMNAEKIAGLAAQTAPTPLWQGAFEQLGNSQVESRFADHRTYFYKGEEVDQQVHLGFDLAVTSAIPVLAANAGTVVYADNLGIYGNTVVLDHGLGVQSLYAHLSAMAVKVGDKVTKKQPLGRSGMTGLAGGDHLHFTVLVQGHPVNAAEWWDPHWIEDRVARKLREAADLH